MKARKKDRSVREIVAEAGHALHDGDEAGVVAALNEAAARDPRDLQLHFITALAAWRLNDTAKALMLAKSCFDRDPANGTIAEVAASLAAQSGDLKESLFYGKLAIALPADELMKGWLPQGFPTFEKAFLAIQDKPLLAQARLLAAGGQLAAATDKARQHVEVAPSDAEGRLFCAGLMLRVGEAAGAIEVLLSPSATEELPPPSASMLAHGFAAVGEAETAMRGHESAVIGAPDDAAIAARRIADAPWLGVADEERELWIKDWVQRFGGGAKARQRRPLGDKLVIGYFVSGFGDRADAAAIGAIARAHTRPGVVAIGYGLGEQSWSENAPLSGAFTKWRNVIGVDHATLVKMVAADGVDVLIDAGGFATPNQLRALARINTALRVGWTGAARALAPQIYDAVVASRSSRLAGDVEAWRLPYAGYPLIRDWIRPLARLPDQRCRFGADVLLSQIDAATAALWRGVLTAAPDAALLLRANDMAAPANIDRLIRRFGVELAARVDVVAAADADEFYRQVDVALAPVRGSSPYMAATALALAVPVVALEDGGAFEPYPAFLRDLGLDAMIATGAENYVRIALSLAGSADARAAAVAATAARGEGSAAEIAQAIEGAARSSLSRVAA